MEVLIVAKTRMSWQYCCVGGLELQTNRSLRLLQSNEQNMPFDLPLDVGEVWEIEYTPRQKPKPPHIEDVLVTRYDYLRRQLNLCAFLRARIQVWQGQPDRLFGGKLRATSSGSGYVCARAGMPDRSTGYWIPDQDLLQEEFKGRVRYIYSGVQSIRNLPYIGFAQSIARIPKGTLLRVSLARWWKPDDKPEMEERCYLQLSGWYLY